MPPARAIGPMASATSSMPGMPSRKTVPAPAANNATVPVPRPPKQVMAKSVQGSRTSSTTMMAAPAPVEAMPVPERRTPPRPTAPAAPIEAKATELPVPEKRSAAMEEMAKRAAAVRGVPASTEKKADGSSVDGVAPVVVPRKTASPESAAMKALNAKKDEIAKKIASGSIAAPSKSMAVGVPTRMGASAGPSIKERYATEGSAPIVAKPPVVVAASASANSQIKEAQAAVQDALKEVAGATGRAIHIHVHAPVHIHLGSPSGNNSKL